MPMYKWHFADFKEPPKIKLLKMETNIKLFIKTQQGIINKAKKLSTNYD